ncbi:MAG: O-antigen ligase family protein [bacterium]
MFDFAGFGFKPVDLMIAFLIIRFVKQAFFDGKKYPIPKSSVFILLAILLLIIPLSLIYPLSKGNTEHIIQFFKTSSHFYYLSFIGLYFFLDPPDEKVLTRCIQIFLIISLITNIFAVYQIFARGFDLPLAWIKFTNVGYVARGMHESIEDFSQLSLQYENFYRATSYFPEPSSLAALNVLVILLNIVPFIQKTGMFFKKKALNIAVFGFSIIAAFLTFSLTGALGIGMILVALLIFNFNRVKKYILPILIGSIVVLFIVDTIVNAYLGVSVAGLFWNRISFLFGYGGMSTGMQGESFFGRMGSQIVSIKIWTISPLFGIGFGGTSFYGQQFDNTSNLAYKILFPDTALVGLLSETGIFSALVFTGMFGLLFYKGFQYIKNIDNMNLSPDMKRFAGIIFFWMLEMFEINFITGYPLISDWFWIPFGFILAVEHRILIQNNAPIYILSFSKRPLIEYFLKGLANNINNNDKE